MKTKILDVTSGDPTPLIAEAIAALNEGRLVAFPTETVYGLGADAFNAAAVKRVFDVKGRPPDNPLIIHIANVGQLDAVAAQVPPVAKTLAENFWPGPLTLVIEHCGNVPGIVTAGLKTAAFRVPNHAVTLKLISAFGRGIVGPSANLSGRPSPTTAMHVLADLKGMVEIILDGGPTVWGIESTVLDVTTDPPAILRLGSLTRERIEGVIGSVSDATSDDALKRSPGTRHRHYAPMARVELVEIGNTAQFTEKMEASRKKGKVVGGIVHSIDSPNDVMSFVERISVKDYPRELFNLLRRFDDIRVDVILIESVPETGMGEAVMDRLRKAAEPK